MDISDFLTHPASAITDPKEGMLLLSAPMMVDNFFTRSVVLLIERGKTGTHTGLILNHSLDLNLNQIIEGIDTQVDVPLFNGGPVDLTKMFVLHKLGDKIRDCIEILPGIFTGGNNSDIMDCIESGEMPDGSFRLFFGICGWESNQLTKEILENSWAVNPTPNPVDLLTGEGDSYWRREVRKLGESHRSWLSMPIHPSFN